MSSNLILPKKIYAMYHFFEKCKKTDWLSLNFKPFKPQFINVDPSLNIMIATNISDLNFYIVDFPFSNHVNPSYLMQYFKDPKLRNLYSDSSINFKVIKTYNRNKSIEMETYRDNTNTLTCYSSKFQILFYDENIDDNKNMSFTKPYYAFKILSNNDNYVLRFEIVLNFLDIDQEIDLHIYICMITKMLKAIYKKFNL